jgi:hypothetical protein
VKIASTLLTVAAALPALAHATTITFDDLAGAGAMPAGYAGFSWDGWYHYDHYDGPFYEPKSGKTRINDPGNAGSNNSFYSASDFTFQGASISGPAATTVYYKLFRDGTLVHTSPVTRLSGAHQFVASGYAGAIDRVSIIGVVSDQYVVDDVVVGVVPEPSTYLLALAGALVVTVQVRRHSAARL